MLIDEEVHVIVLLVVQVPLELHDFLIQLLLRFVRFLELSHEELPLTGKFFLDADLARQDFKQGARHNRSKFPDVVDKHDVCQV